MAKKMLKSKIILLIAIVCVVVSLVAVFASADNSVSDGAKNFSAGELYELQKNVTPDGSVTIEAEIYLPESARTGRAGSIISNYNNGTYNGLRY